MVFYQFIQFIRLVGRKRNRIPSRLIHRSSGQDRIVWNGQTVYLGLHGSAESDENYRQVVKRILTTGEAVLEPSKLTVEFLCERFMVNIQETFPPESREPMAYRYAMTLVKHHFGSAPIESVTPAKFAAMRDEWARNSSVRTVNKHHNQAIAAFRWGVTAELVPSHVWHALLAVPKLKPRRSPARDPKSIEPIDWASVEKVKDRVRPQVWTMIVVQWHTGMRSGELLAMTPGQIVDWVYRPGKHKNAWRGHAREIPLGPKCREALAEVIAGKGPDDPVFPGYTPQSYGRAVARACKALGIPHWHPHQIRHAYATRVRASHGLDAAQAVLGHKTARVTEIYAERSTGLAKKVVEDLG